MANDPRFESSSTAEVPFRLTFIGCHKPHAVSSARCQGRTITNYAWIGHDVRFQLEKLQSFYGTWGVKLFHFPGVARAQHLPEVARAAFGDDFLDLILHHVFVARQIIPSAENAEGCRETRPVFHVGKQESIRRPW